MPEPHLKPVSIVVNGTQVPMTGHKATGKEIKEAAIAKGVKIQLDFNLFRIEGDRQYPVGDADTVALHEGEAFRAVAGDDNS